MNGSTLRPDGVTLWPMGRAVECMVDPVVAEKDTGIALISTTVAICAIDAHELSKSGVIVQLLAICYSPW